MKDKLDSYITSELLPKKEFVCIHGIDKRSVPVSDKGREIEASFEIFLDKEKSIQFVKCLNEHINRMK